MFKSEDFNTLFFFQKTNFVVQFIEWETPDTETVVLNFRGTIPGNRNLITFKAKFNVSNYELTVADKINNYIVKLISFNEKKELANKVNYYLSITGRAGYNHSHQCHICYGWEKCDDKDCTITVQDGGETVDLMYGDPYTSHEKCKDEYRYICGLVKNTNFVITHLNISIYKSGDKFMVSYSDAPVKEFTDVDEAVTYFLKYGN